MRNRELWSGGKIWFPAPEEQAHRKLEGFSRKQLDMGHRTTRGEAAAPPPENNTTWFFVFLQCNWTDKTEQTTSRESAYWLQSCRESIPETFIV